ncbi:MAG: AAC(3) family N-acetyltransferase [Nitrospirae bacterium]|nr:AAC(3) family N-acetyltransferase [Nitrospirota bacterium]
MKFINKEDIIKSLIEVGVNKGQTIYIQSDLSTIGMIEGAKSKEDFCKVYFDSIFELIGKDGTIVVPTYSTQVARFDIDFIWEETPSLMGIFSEYIRCHPDSLRSIHPLKSFCAIGKKKEAICANNSSNDYGWNSPFHRMFQHKAKLLTLGLESGYVVAIVHHLEAFYGVPYIYNKLLKWSPIVNGKIDERVFFSSVRYLTLNVDEYDLTTFVKHVRKLGGVKSSKLGMSSVHMSDFEQVFFEGIQLLNKNPYVFLKKAPDFKYGEIPFDGPTYKVDNIAEDKDITNMNNMNWEGYYLLGKKSIGGD